MSGNGSFYCRDNVMKKQEDKGKIMSPLALENDQ